MKHSHFIIYKPYGYLSQFVNNGPKKKTKKLLGELYHFPKGLMSIGRLDEDSEGLLMLTTDGLKSEQIRSSLVEKEYFVQLDGLINSQALQQLTKGVEIGFDGKKYTTSACRASQISPPMLRERSKKIRDDRHGPTCWVSIIINEGKFRQVRKMTAAVGFPTLRLVRYRIGDYTLNDLGDDMVKKIDDIVMTIQ